MVMKKFEIDNQVNRLKSIRNAYINEHRRMEDEVQLILPKQIHKLSMTVDYYKSDMEFAEQNPEPDPFDIEIGGEHYDKRSNALEAIVQQKSHLKENELLPIGTYRGFHLYLYQEGVGSFKNLCLTVKHNLGYRVEIDPSTGTGNLVRLNNVISHDIPKKHKEAVSDLARLDIVVDDMVVHNAKIIKGKDDVPRLTMPSYKAKDGNHTSICIPATKEAYAEFNEKAINEFNTQAGVKVQIHQNAQGENIAKIHPNDVGKVNQVIAPPTNTFHK